MSKKQITIHQLKDSMRYVFDDVYGRVDLTDYDNWVGFTHVCETVWHNLHKQKSKKRKLELSKTPPKYQKLFKIPLVGDICLKKEEA